MRDTKKFFIQNSDVQNFPVCTICYLYNGESAIRKGDFDAVLLKYFAALILHECQIAKSVSGDQFVMLQVGQVPFNSAIFS